MREFFDAEVGTAALPDTRVRDAAGAMTRSTDETTLALTDALSPDWPQAVSWENDRILGTQVPSHLTRHVDYAALIKRGSDTVSFNVQAPLVWIMFNKHKEEGRNTCFIATLLPDSAYTGDTARIGSNPAGSDFWGIAIYSLPDGTPLWGVRYENGVAANQLVFNSQTDLPVDPDLSVGLGFGSGQMTRMTGEYKETAILMDSVPCIATVVEDDDTSDDNWWYPRNENENNNDYFIFGGGGGGSSGGGDGKNDNNGQGYTVSVSASPMEGGTVSGGGSYPFNSSATISAIPKPGFDFIRWTGSRTYSYNNFEVTVTSDMSFTAVFESNGDIDKSPCSDLVNNKSNPVANMELAPPSSWNIKGATYGNTRTKPNGDPKLHNGIDLAGAVGTPIYAQFDGAIGQIVDEQPNRVLENGLRVYPEGYSGDKDGAGNRIFVNSTIDGKTVSNGYWHLRADTPIANNPRTGQPWATGDIIYAGQLIGYIGITGNADPNIPHLHLNTKEGGVSTNPTDYLSATVSTTKTTITTPCD